LAGIMVIMNHVRLARKDQILLYQGEATSTVNLIREGCIKVYTTLANGNEVIVALFGPGDYFPVGEVSDSALTSLFYHETLVDSTIESMRVDEYLDRLKNNPNLPQYYARRYQGALLHITALVQTTAYEKLAHTLRYLAMRFGTELIGKRYTRIDMPLTQKIIANLSNMSRETTSIELQKLKKQQIVLERSKYYSVDMQAITNLLGDDLDEMVTNL
jgi:CRP-like cAMP-binding protein